jgi:hypothetical protein
MEWTRDGERQRETENEKERNYFSTLAAEERF